MVLSNPEIVLQASELLQQGKTYREIQEILKKKFGKGLSNNTLKKIRKNLTENCSKDREIARLNQELSLFKNLYFELLEETKRSLNTKNRSQ